MQLSPLNLALLVANDQLDAEPAPVKSLRKKTVESVHCWRCVECCELHEFLSDAEDCCAEEWIKAGPSFAQCPICATDHGNHSDSWRLAADCCLWKDLDAPTRWAIADAVEGDSTWAEQLQASPNH